MICTLYFNLKANVAKNERGDIDPTSDISNVDEIYYDPYSFCCNVCFVVVCV